MMLILLAVSLFAQEHKSSAEKTPYFDEPTFIAAGVTDNSNRGGHGSDVILRSTELLAKATAALSGTHQSKGDVEERLGHPIEALREYRRAVELDPSEANIYALGDELLTHLAPDKAVEVFTRGVRLFPRSSRMLLGLAVVSYSTGAYDQAKQQFFAACDLDPSDPVPYLFLGKVQARELTEADGFAARMQRFATLHPENAWADYYYAISLKKHSAEAQSLLEKAVRLDPQLAEGWQELGILHYERNEDGKAIAAWQNAVAANPQMEAAHYRLAQAYRRIGEPAKAKTEIELFEQLSKQSAEKLDHERAAIKRFVFDH